MNLIAWRYRRFHTSFLLGWLAFGLLIGLAVAAMSSIYIHPIWIVSLLLLALSMFHRARWWSVIVLVLCGMLLGWSKGSDMNIAFTPYREAADMTVTMTGRVADDPKVGKKSNTAFTLSGIALNGKKLPGEVYVSTYSNHVLKRGDYVALKGKMTRGFGSYQAKMSFATVSGVNVANDPIRDFRDSFSTQLRKVVDEPAASLGIGFVVGQRSALPEELDDDLRAVGLTHIVVASGYNLTILVRFARRMLEKQSKYLAAIVSGGLMVLFTLISGLSPSMTRASIVTGLSLLAWYYGRRFHPLLLILYVAALTAYINPVYLWSDVGWHLSFLAFGGVLIVSPLLVNAVFKQRKPHPLVQVAFETSAAQLMTLPLTLMVFGNLPVFSLLSNVLVASIIPLAMAATAIAGGLGMISLNLAVYPGLFAELVLGYVLGIVEILSSPTWSQLEFSISPLFMILSYVAIILSMVLLYVRSRYNFRSASIVD